MAGRGTRLRPHTLTVPKPLIPIAGKPMVQRLVEDLNRGLDEKVDEIAFIIGDFGKEVEQQLKEIAKSKTELTFKQLFDSVELRDKIIKYTKGKNEENFDRLENELSKMKGK